MKFRVRVDGRMARQRGRKQEALSRLFVEVQKRCGDKPLIFDNQLAKEVTGTEFSNQYDVTKIDTSAKLPAELLESDYFVIHLGGGRHQFVRGIKAGYHELEPIPAEDTIEWKYRRSLLNEVDTTHTNVLNLVNNSQILSDFLYDEILPAVNLLPPHRIRVSFDCYVGTQLVRINKLQTKTGMIFEHYGEIAICEGRRGNSVDFAVCSLYNSFRYFCRFRDENGLPIKSTTVALANQVAHAGSTALELRRYEFGQQEKMDSLRLNKATRYALVAGG